MIPLILLFRNNYIKKMSTLHQLKISQNMKSMNISLASVSTKILISAHRDMFLSDVPPTKCMGI